MAVATKPPETPSNSSETLQDLVQRRQKGDALALQRILQNPNLVDAVGGDLALQAEL